MSEKSPHQYQDRRFPKEHGVAMRRTMLSVSPVSFNVVADHVYQTFLFQIATFLSLASGII